MENQCRNCHQGHGLTPLFNDHHVLKCHACSAYQFVGPISNVAELYTEDYYTGSEYINYELASPVYRMNFQRKLEVMKKHLPELKYEEMRVLEIGSATGDFMQVLKDRGVSNILGVEASEFSRRRAGERGFRVIDPFEPEYPRLVREFAPNVICAWDVWEHLEYPGDIFRSLLAENPGVKLVSISTVDSGALVPRLKGKKWRQFHPPTHINYPTKKSFDIYFQTVGFRVISNTAFGYYRPLADYLSLVIKTEWLNKLPFLFKIPLLVNLFDIQMVVARRN